MLVFAGILLILAGVAAFFSNGFIAMTAKAGEMHNSRLDVGRIVFKTAGVLIALYGVYMIVLGLC